MKTGNAGEATSNAFEYMECRNYSLKSQKYCCMKQKHLYIAHVVLFKQMCKEQPLMGVVLDGGVMSKFPGPQILYLYNERFVLGLYHLLNLRYRLYLNKNFYTRILNK